MATVVNEKKKYGLEGQYDLSEHVGSSQEFQQCVDSIGHLWGLSISATRDQTVVAGRWDNENILENPIKAEVRNLLKRAGSENWDGEGAYALDREIVEIAEKIVDEFPSDIGRPIVSASLRGDVDFDWVINQNLMLTVSVVKSKEIVFALMVDDLQLSGSVPWKNGTLPNVLDCFFEQLRKA